MKSKKISQLLNNVTMLAMPGSLRSKEVSGALQKLKEVHVV